MYIAFQFIPSGTAEYMELKDKITAASPREPTDFEMFI